MKLAPKVSMSASLKRMTVHTQSPRSTMRTDLSGVATPRMKPFTVGAGSAAGCKGSELPSQEQIRRSLILEVETRVACERSMSSKAHAAKSSSDMLVQGSRHSRSLTPSRGSREACRYHCPTGSTLYTPRGTRFSDNLGKQDDQKPKHHTSNSVMEQCRFYQESRARSAGPERRAVLETGAGGCAGFANRKRLDTPGGLTECIGTFRSATPDYHRRYASNMAGSSLKVGDTSCATEQRRCGATSSPRSHSTAAVTPSAFACRGEQLAPWERQDSRPLSRCSVGLRPTKGSVRPWAMSFSSMQTCK